MVFSACRAGEISSSERSHRKKFSRHLEFFIQWKTGERKKVLPRGRMIGMIKDRGEGGAKKISGPPEIIVLFRSPTYGVSDWCGSTLPVNSHPPIHPPPFNREFKITTTATATGMSLNKRFNEQNNSCARAL